MPRRTCAPGRRTSNDDEETILDWRHGEGDWRSANEIASGVEIRPPTVHKRPASLGKGFAVQSRTRTGKAANSSTSCGAVRSPHAPPLGRGAANQEAARHNAALRHAESV